MASSKTNQTARPPYKGPSVVLQSVWNLSVCCAAKNSYVTKCEKDAAATLATATATCEAHASEKKLAGAAKNSFTKKCIKDATGG